MLNVCSPSVVSNQVILKCLAFDVAGNVTLNITADVAAKRFNKTFLVNWSFFFKEERKKSNIKLTSLSQANFQLKMEKDEKRSCVC